MKYIIGLLVLGFLVFIHELGHFSMAKLRKMPVKAFALGFGPAIFKCKKGETEYRLNILPFGGYVQIEGEGDEETDNPRAFNNQKWYSRLIVLLAGIFNNFLSAFIIILGLILVCGVPEKVTQIYNIVPNKPVSQYLKIDDEIVSVNNHKVNEDNNENITNWIKEGKDIVNINIKRAGETISYTIPLHKGENGNKLLGISYAQNLIFSKEGNICTALFYMPYHTTTDIFKMIFESFKMMATGQVPMKDISGPVGIVKTTGDVAQTSIPMLMYWIAILDINLGIMNVLPIPALDGGQTLFLILEQIAGKKWLKRKTVNIINTVFLTILFGFSIIITFKDILQLI